MEDSELGRRSRGRSPIPPSSSIRGHAYGPSWQQSQAPQFRYRFFKGARAETVRELAAGVGDLIGRDVVVVPEQALVGEVESGRVGLLEQLRDERASHAVPCERGPREHIQEAVHRRARTI